MTDQHREEASSGSDDVVDDTVRGSRHPERQIEAEADHTMISRRRRAAADSDDTLISRRRTGAAGGGTGGRDGAAGIEHDHDHDTLPSQRKSVPGESHVARVETGALETTRLAGLADPPQSAGLIEADDAVRGDGAGREPAIDDRLGLRREERESDGGHSQPRAASTPHPPLVKAPYRPREVPSSPVVRLDAIARDLQTPAHTARAAEQQWARSRKRLIGIGVVSAIIGVAGITGIGFLVLSLLGG